MNGHNTFNYYKFDYDYFVYFYMILKLIIENIKNNKTQVELFSNFKFSYDSELATYLGLIHNPSAPEFLQKYKSMNYMVNFIKKNIDIKDFQIHNENQSLEIDICIESTRQYLKCKKVERKGHFENRVFGNRLYKDRYGYEKYKYFFLYYYMPEVDNKVIGLSVIE
jgi:hypothetical protein